MTLSSVSPSKIFPDHAEGLLILQNLYQLWNGRVIQLPEEVSFLQEQLTDDRVVLFTLLLHPSIIYALLFIS